MKGQHYPRRMFEQAELTWADAPPEGDKVTQGAWWKSANAAQIAVDEGVAQRLNLGVGSAVELETGGTTHALTVGAIYEPTGSTWARASSLCCLPESSRTSLRPGMAACISIPNRWRLWSGRCLPPIPRLR